VSSIRQKVHGSNKYEIILIATDEKRHQVNPEARLRISLTVALILGTTVPEGSKMAITAEMNVIAHK